MPRSRFILASIALLTLGFVHGQSPDAARPIDQGQHVFIMGNSFQVFVDHHLNVNATAAGIKGHLRGGDPLAPIKVDVVASNPWFRIHDKADKSLDDLADKALRHNPNIRVLAQVGWLPYDDPVFPEPEKGHPKTDWNKRSMKEVRAIHASYLKNAAAQVDATNKRLGKTVVSLVPTAQAVMSLREKVVAGEAPGLTSQDDLFSDSIGHAKPPIERLNGYCHFAVVYRRSPVALPIKGTKDEKLERVLQEIAWDAVVKEPFSGLVSESK